MFLQYTFLKPDCTNILIPRYETFSRPRNVSLPNKQPLNQYLTLTKYFSNNSFIVLFVIIFFNSHSKIRAHQMPTVSVSPENTERPYDHTSGLRQNLPMSGWSTTLSIPMSTFPDRRNQKSDSTDK